MTQPAGMRLLVFDTKWYFNHRYYEKLVAKGVEIVRLFEPGELEKVELSEFDGLLAHPGMENQRDFFTRVARHPKLKVAVISDEPGVYDTDSTDISVFYVKHID